MVVGCREDKCEGRVALTSGREAYTEARKADGASSTALRTPNPPDLTDKEAWDQYGLLVSSGVFVTLLKMEHSTAPYSAKDVDLKQGAVHNRYISFGMEKEWTRSNRASWAERTPTSRQFSLEFESSL